MAEPDNIARMYANYDGDTGEPIILKADRKTPATTIGGSSSGVTKPPRIVILGDSIAFEWGKLSPVSPLYWSLVQTPRAMDFTQGTLAARGGSNLAQSGSKSGTLLSTTGTTLYTALTTDLNTPEKIAAIQAFAPDTAIIISGTNDNGFANVAVNQTFANVKAVCDACTTIKNIIVVPVLPKTGALSAGAYDVIFKTYQLYKQWERTTAGVRVLDLSSVMLDDTTSWNAAGVAGTAGAMTTDNLHPAMAFGRAAAPQVTQMLDDLRVPRIAPRGVSQVDVYSAAMPTGNALGTAGTFAGTGGTVGANAAGVVATGWTLSTNNAELTVTGSKGTLAVRGQNKTSQILTFAAGAPLTAARTVTLTRSVAAASAAMTLAHMAQVIAQFANLVGCYSIRLQVLGSGGTVYPMLEHGTASESPATASHDYPTSATPETLEVVHPGSVTFDAGNTGGFTFTLTMTFRTGTTPAGTIAFAQAGAWAIPVLP